MAITDLTGTKWEFESTLSDNISLDVSINYTSNDTSFDRLFVVFVPAANMARIIYAAGQTQTDAYNKGWLNDAFKAIEITGGTDATNASLIAFIEAHATQVVDPTDVMISYGGSYIATMSDSGTEVLETAGKYLTDDITINYTKSGGIVPSGTISIASNGTYDVASYASDEVNVSGGGVQTTAITATISKGTAYYTDASGTVQTVTTTAVPMPGSPPTISDNAISGSLFVCMSTYDLTEISGLTLVTKYDHGSGSTSDKRYTHIYQVD